MRSSALIILDKNNYTNKVIGSDRVFFNSYPYKIKLKDNSINYSWQSASTIEEWFRPDPQEFPEGFRRKFVTKRVSNWGRNFYFSDKGVMDEFADSFSDDIDYICGPISEEHVDALKIVSSQSKSDEVINVIKGNKYFDEYDMKFIWRWPSHMITNLSVDQDSIIEYWGKLAIAIEEMAENSSRNYYRNVYLHSEDMDEVEFFCKLKYGDVIYQKVKILLIENL